MMVRSLDTSFLKVCHRRKGIRTKGGCLPVKGMKDWWYWLASALGGWAASVWAGVKSLVERGHGRAGSMQINQGENNARNKKRINIAANFKVKKAVSKRRGVEWYFPLQTSLAHQAEGPHVTLTRGPDKCDALPMGDLGLCMAEAFTPLRLNESSARIPNTRNAHLEVSVIRMREWK